MPRVRLAHAVAGSAALLLAIGGCGAAGEETGGAAQSAEVVWAGTVCEAVADGAAKVPQFPRLDPDPGKTKQGFVTHVRTVSGALDGVRDAMTGLGAPPVGDGKAVFDKAVGKLGKAVKSLEGAATKLEKVAAKDQKNMRDAMDSVRKAVTDAGTAKGLVKDMRANAVLDKAFGQAAACREFAV